MELESGTEVEVLVEVEDEAEDEAEEDEELVEVDVVEKVEVLVLELMEELNRGQGGISWLGARGAHASFPRGKRTWKKCWRTKKWKWTWKWTWKWMWKRMYWWTWS